MKNRILHGGERRAALFSAAVLSGCLVLSTTATAQFYTFDETVEAVDPGAWNSWDFSSQDVTIAFGEDNEATVTVEPGGELVAGLLFMGVGDESASGFLNISGVTAETEPRPATFRQSPMETGFETYIGFDGYGEVMVSDGGLFSTRVNYTAFNPGSSGKVTITGPETVWDVNNVTLRVGQQGHGVLHVLDGARVENISNSFLGNLSVEDESTGEVIGGGSVEIVIEGGASIVGSGLSRIANRESTAADMTVRGAGSLYEMGDFIHLSSGGEATVLIEDGGTIRSGGTMSLAAGTRTTDKLGTAHVHVTGEDSLLESGSWLYVGRGGDVTDDEGNVLEQWGTSATLLVDNGGTVRSGTHFRLSREPGGFGEATFTGQGTTLDVGSYTHIPTLGEGVLNILDGAVAIVPSNNHFGREPGGVGTINVSNAQVLGGNFTYVGNEGEATLNVTNGGYFFSDNIFYVARQETATGHVNVTGEGSWIETTGSFRVGADPDLNPTGGVTTFTISEGGKVSSTFDFVARGESTVTLNDGTIELVPDDETGERGVVSIGEQALLTGQGTIFGNLELLAGGTIQGTGDGLGLHGALTGVGSVENLLFSDLTMLSSDEVPSLVNSRFAPGGQFNIVVDAPTDGLINGDAATDYSNAHLTVTFEPFEPGSEATFQLFAGEAALNFASASLPSGWELTGDGVLQHTGADPDPDGEFADWAASFNLSGDDAAPDGNPSGDGFNNTQKFAFGIDPTKAVAALSQVSGDETAVTLRWNRSTNAGIDYVIERRSSLTEGEWEAVPGASPEVMADPDVAAPDGYERVEWTVELGGGEDAAFYRARAVVEAALLP